MVVMPTTPIGKQIIIGAAVDVYTAAAVYGVDVAAATIGNGCGSWMLRSRRCVRSGIVM